MSNDQNQNPPSQTPPANATMELAARIVNHPVFTLLMVQHVASIINLAGAVTTEEEAVEAVEKFSAQREAEKKKKNGGDFDA